MKILTLAKEFGSFLRTHMRWWLIPAIVLLLAIAALVLLSNGPSVSPFLYHR